MMEGFFSTSKVTVEYYDPSGLYPLIAPQLSSRLPLRNLFWKSPSRPLRSIDSLHIELVPSPVSSTDGSRPSSAGQQSTHTAQENLGQTGTPDVRTEGTTGAVKARRHQIPGLRKTPYLKIYLLRCDDSDSYKATSRKLLRDWVRENTPPSQGSAGQDDHDACEWLILHVVLPGTAAASQPRSSGSGGGSGPSTEKSGSSSRWPGRGSNTILEKIRSDFNTSGKSAPDRVAQVRVQKKDLPPNFVSAPSDPSVSVYNESPQEQAHAWNDLVAKLKALILLSFDARVTQYEDDIREKDAQRAIPGWNFCTFFVLKEGLARGFESVGLTEDALAGYDELSAGLDLIVDEEASNTSESKGSTFLTYTKDLQQQLSEFVGFAAREPAEAENSGEHQALDKAWEKPLGSMRKNYRELIVSTNISLFDFKCYIFSRQMSLLLRLANAHSSRAELTTNGAMSATGTDPRRYSQGADQSAAQVSSETEDLYSLAEVCRRALQFITSVVRIMKDDLWNGAKMDPYEGVEAIINNLTSSWSFLVASQVLDETKTLSLPVSSYVEDAGTASSDKTITELAQAENVKVLVAEPKMLVHPVRTSSLPHQASTNGEQTNSRPSCGQVDTEAAGLFDATARPKNENSGHTTYGLEELAASRAELYLFQRRMLENIGKARGWSTGWSAIPVYGRLLNEFIDVDLNGDASAENVRLSKASSSHQLPSIGLCSQVLRRAVSSITEFRSFYERFSNVALKHYHISGRVKSSERLMGDLAALKFDSGDFAAAATYLRQAAPIYAHNRWNRIESSMLRLNAVCLKQLQQKDEYVRVALMLLAKSAANERSRILSRKGKVDERSAVLSTYSSSSAWLNEDYNDTSGYLTELIQYTEQFSHGMSIPLMSYFVDIQVGPYVRHFPDRDGFQLQLVFRHLLEDEVMFQKAKVRLTSTVASQNRDIWLESDDPVHSKRGLVKAWVCTNVGINMRLTAREADQHAQANTFGTYAVDKVILEVSKITFVYEPHAETKVPNISLPTHDPSPVPEGTKSSHILCYPRAEAFQATLSTSPSVHVGRIKSIDIECASGWNDIDRAEIRVKSATAGLRLHTADAKLIDGQCSVVATSQPGVLQCTNIKSQSVEKLRIPYDLENELDEMSVGIEVTYSTANGDFSYFTLTTLAVELPLDVDVQDIFKESCLFSRFNIRSAGQSPILVDSVELHGSNTHAVKALGSISSPMIILPNQPLCLTYKVSDVRGKEERGGGDFLPLTLVVGYRPLNELILDSVERRLTMSLKKSAFQRYSRVLIPSVLQRLRGSIVGSECEAISLTSMVSLPSYAELGWEETLPGLPETVRSELRQFLKNWREENATFPLELASDADTERSIELRQITITVPIPRVQILHTVSLDILDLDQSISPSWPVAHVGRPLTAELKIKHTRQWSDSNSLKAAAGLSNESDPLEFFYEIKASSDVWLVGGQRRARFSSIEVEVQTFPVILIPLVAGRLLLPSVDIRPSVSSSTSSRIPQRADASHSPAPQDRARNNEDPFTCELDYQSRGETIIVLSDTHCTTAGLQFGSQPSAQVSANAAAARDTSALESLH